VAVRVGASPLVGGHTGGSRTVNTGEKVVLEGLSLTLMTQEGRGGGDKKGYPFQYLWACRRLSPADPIPISTDTNVSALIDDLNSDTEQ